LQVYDCCIFAAVVLPGFAVRMGRGVLGMEVPQLGPGAES